MSPTLPDAQQRKAELDDAEAQTGTDEPPEREPFDLGRLELDDALELDDGQICILLSAGC